MQSEAKGQTQSDALLNILNQAFYTPIEVAAVLRVSRLTIYKKIESGEIPFRKVDGKWKLSRAEFYKYLREKYGPQPNQAGAS